MSLRSGVPGPPPSSWLCQNSRGVEASATRVLELPILKFFNCIFKNLFIWGFGHSMQHVGCKFPD